MKRVILIALLVIALFAVVPAIADENEADNKAPAPPKIDAGHSKPNSQPEQAHHESSKHHEQHHDSQTAHHESNKGHTAHHEASTEHSRWPHWANHHHWRGHSSGWHVFTVVWFFVSLGIFAFGVLIAIVLVAVKTVRRCRASAPQKKEGFEPLIETKTPPQLDA